MNLLDHFLCCCCLCLCDRCALFREELLSVSVSASEINLNLCADNDTHFVQYELHFTCVSSLIVIISFCYLLFKYIYSVTFDGVACLFAIACHIATILQACTVLFSLSARVICLVYVLWLVNAVRSEWKTCVGICVPFA